MLLCALLFAGPATAQDQRGGIQGVVKDSQAAVIPGVLVEAHSATGATASTTTDTNGSFRFPSLQPGVYEIDATIAGFKPGKITDVHVQLGEVRTVDFTLPVATVAETVNVTATSPVVDFTQSQRAVNIHAERIELLPHGRDFTTLVTQAPGANQEAKLGGLSIDGASAGENRYIVDGMETTNLQSGLSGKGLIADFVEEVQVKSSGYTAEYGGAMGGVINAVTKSGTNEFRGFGLFNWQGAKLAGGAGAPSIIANTGNSGVPTLRISLTDQNASEYITYPQDQWNRYEPAIAIGGPIAVNKAWFWAAYMPVTTPMKRTVTLTATRNPISVDRKELIQNMSANQTSQISSGIRTRVSFNNSWQKADGLLPALNGTDVVGTNYGKGSVFPNWTLSANADWVVSPKVFVGLRGGYYDSDRHDTNVTEQPQFVFQSSNVGLAGVPADLQHPTAFNSIPSNQKVTQDQQTRAFFQVDTTWYGNLHGQHQFKGGVQLDRLGNNVLSGNARPVVRMFWNQPLTSGSPVQRGAFGYYEVRSNGVDPSKGIITEGNVHSTNIGLFIQDAWTVASGLTINAGIRTEREQVPAYTTGPDIPDFGIKFSFKDKLAPRAGFAYDVKHDGKWKVSGSWGIFYDIFKLELPRGSFGGDKWLSYYYALDTPNWPTLLDSSGCPPACPGTKIRGPIDFRHPSFGSDSIEPDLKPMRSQEAMLGLDHEFNSTMAVNVRYVHKQLDRVVEDTGSLDADGNEIYIIANSGEGLTSLAFTSPQVAMPKPQRDYDSVEFAFDKRMSHNWYLRASYLWSRLYGNYTGLTQSDESGRTSPNVGRAYDYPLMMFTGTGEAAFGNLPTDRPGQFKTQFIYAFPFGTSVGFNQYLASGIPVTREAAVLPTSFYPVQYLGRGSDGRTPIYSQSDLYVQHEIKLSGNRRLQVNANVQNLFNQRTEISNFSTQVRSGNGLTFNEAAFYRGQVNFPALISAGSAAVTAGGPTFTDPRFLLANDYQSPIMVRLGVKLMF
jgi:hypothetical protein